MKRFFAIMLLGALALWPGNCSGDAPTPSPAETSPLPDMPSPDEYMSALCALLGEHDLPFEEQGQYALSISSCIALSVRAQDGAISSITIRAQGDGSALSGETIIRALVCAVRACSPADPAMVQSKLIDIISQTSGTGSLPGLAIEFSLTPEALDIALTPAEQPSALPKPTNAHHRAGSIGQVISQCALILPEGWTQTSYRIGDPPDVLLNIYATSSEPDALWECARAVMAQYFCQVRDSALECGRLSLVFYSPDMTPLMSLGVGRADALSSDVITDKSASTDEFCAELERLEAESDALIVRHYESAG